MIDPLWEMDHLLVLVADEVRVTAKCQPFNSAHEGYAVLVEQTEELWNHVKTPPNRREFWAMRLQAIKVAAMAVRFAVELCDEKRGRK